MPADHPAPRSASGHGANTPRGLRARPDRDPGPGRFGRMFGDVAAHELSDAAIEGLAERMQAASQFVGPGDNPAIHAGYTYFAQFVDHDITFDPSSLRERREDPQGRLNFRTPRLDLDSLYGSGPDDQPYLYESEDPDDRGVKLLVQRRGRSTPAAFDDLPRNSQGRALIGDPRNDEHAIIAQLQLLFIAFHNAVVEHVRDTRGLAGAALFGAARRLVLWHYQWIVAHDFLRRIVGAGRAAEVTAPGYERRWFVWDREPFIPLEFSGAAYRFGHSMVRLSYRMSAQQVGAGAGEIPIFPRDGSDGLRGHRRLPADLVIDWRFFLDLGELPAALRDVAAIPQQASRIDTMLSRSLFRLPADVGTDGTPTLALLNLRRGRKLALPSGPAIARAMGERPLDAAQLELRDEAIDAELLEHTPLWYYVLCEASALHAGEHLGPVGGGIVSEVLLGLLQGDPDSYLHASPAWTPELDGETPGDFTLPDLVRFAYPQYRRRGA